MKISGTLTNVCGRKEWLDEWKGGMIYGWMDRQMDKVILRSKVKLLDGWIGGSWVDGIKEKWGEWID